MSQNHTVVKTFTVGDTRVALADTLVDINLEPIDLTDMDVVLRMVDDDGIVKVDDAVAIIDADPETGKISYSWADADVDTAGTYRYWWIVEDIGGRVEHYPADGRKRKIIFVEPD